MNKKRLKQLGKQLWLKLLMIAASMSIALILTSCSSGGGSSSVSTSSNTNSGTGGTGTTMPISLLAGNASGAGNVDGTGAAASFHYPYGITTDSSGNIYVSDSLNNIIRKISPAGVTTTFAGTKNVAGSADGTGTAASFFNPRGITTDISGNLYVADMVNDTIRKITPAGVVTTLAGSASVQGSADGTGATASFYRPTSVATDSSGNVYVADSYNRTIRKITPAGVVTTLAGSAGMAGYVNGTGTAARFMFPVGVATDSLGNIYVADSNYIRKITPAGAVTTLAGTGLAGSADGSGTAASFNLPNGLVTDAAGNVYVADTFNSTIRKISPSGVVTTLVGSAGITGTIDGTGPAARFNNPYAIATDSSGNLYAADTFSDTIRKVTSTGTVTTFAGTANATGKADGTGAAASFTYPSGLSLDAAGNVYVLDTGNFLVRKITSAGIVTTYANSTAMGAYYPAYSRFMLTGIATDSTGNTYLVDPNESVIIKITPTGTSAIFAGGILSPGNVDGTGTAAKFNYPSGIAIDSANNLYVTDTNNHSVRKISPTGVVTTLASLGVSSAPTGIATDSAGNVYVVDSMQMITINNSPTYVGNNVIYKITSTGGVTTLAGTAGVTGNADGTGAAASFSLPTGIAIDSLGNLYVADTDNNTIRKITQSGVVTTVVGQAGIMSFAPSNFPGMLARPIGVAIAGHTLYTTSNNAVVQVTNVP